ncbi:TPA: hypothetical protein ACPJ17_003706, partial [Vibrio alginolyticus]
QIFLIDLILYQKLTKRKMTNLQVLTKPAKFKNDPTHNLDVSQFAAHAEHGSSTSKEAFEPEKLKEQN